MTSKQQQPKHQQYDCNERLLRNYLEDVLPEAEQRGVETHLEQCESCRRLISDSAADAAWWGHAGTYLRGDRWDDVPKTRVFSTSVDVPRCGIGASHPPALRQIKEWLDPTDDPRMLGRFGGYEIVGIVGQGGMGVVLKGFDPPLNRYVAIKVLAPLLANSGAARKRFAREAKATAAVLHDNVIPIHRVDEAHDLPYLVMPYVSDVPLQKRIDDEGPLPLVAILRIGEQIAAGLSAAHDHGLVHRDIKPANILLENGVERVRITDFGLARAADDGSLTRTGVIAGTPQYMSPEQARGDSVDARSDLFSLGSVLYAMCTGRLPFRAETPYGILRRIIETEPRAIRDINPETPAWLQSIIAKLHAKRVEDRFGSAAEVAELLRGCLAHVEQPNTVPLPDACRSQPRRFDTITTRRLIQVVGIVLAAAVVGGALTARHALLPQRPVPVGILPETDATDNAAGSVDTYAPDDNPSDDPAIAWDGTAIEIERMLQQARPFEMQARQIWETQPMNPAAAPDSAKTRPWIEECQP